VLAAGTVGTPQLLMLSGIGPAHHLEDLGIDVVADLPGVGAKLFDHSMCGVVYQSAQPVPPGVSNQGEVQGLLSTGMGGPGPDVLFMFVDVPLRADSLPGPDIGHGYAIMVSLMLPFSRRDAAFGQHDPWCTPRDRSRLLHRPARPRHRGCRTAHRPRDRRHARMVPWCGVEALPAPGCGPGKLYAAT
jgi:hypothetical protein